MPVISINVGPKRVHLTAYCPDDELGLLACDYVLARVAELLDGTSETELRRWLIERDPSIADLFAKLDAGWKLPKTGDFTVDPGNASAEARIIRHLLRERIEQCAGRPTEELAVDAAGPIVAPRSVDSRDGRAAGCRMREDVSPGAAQRPPEACDCRKEVNQNNGEPAAQDGRGNESMEA